MKNKLNNIKAPRRLSMFVVAFILLLIMTVCTTIAYIVDKSDTITNTFTFAKSDVEIDEEFDGTIKKNVRVQNTGNTTGYIRVKLLPYWYEENSNRIIAKSAWDVKFTIDDNKWIKGVDGLYYYTEPVAPTEFTGMLIGETGISLIKDDSDGARQVLEIVASSIQAESNNSNNINAVIDAWGINAGGAVTGVDNSYKLIIKTN